MGLSYNQPKFSACVTWNPNAITFTNSNTIGATPSGIYVDISNTVYAVAPILNNVLVWLNEGTFVTRTISGGLNTSYGIVVSSNYDIYVDNGLYNGRVDKWTLNASSSGGQTSPAFLLSTCGSSTLIGSNCSFSTLPCDILKPCQNNGTCINDNTTFSGYICTCLSGFNGTQCQYDYRPCQPNTCSNNGICNETSNTTLLCLCALGWQDIHCQTQINYCESKTCLNNGVCQPLLLNYTCYCLDGSYSGRHCEITSSKTMLFQILAKSFAYIAILAMISAAMFVVIMDVLKYYFGIDPVHQKSKLKKQKKHLKKKRCVIAIRFIYVNTPPSAISREIIRLKVEETSV